MPKIRTTFRPNEEIDVSDHEHGVLNDLGVVLDSTATTEQGLRKAAERQVAANTEQSEG